MDMVKVTCTSPSLTIPALSVQFVDGEALVPADRLDALRAYAIHGVQLPDEASDEQGPANVDDAGDPDNKPADEQGEQGPAEPEADKPKRQTRASAKPFGN